MRWYRIAGRPLQGEILALRPQIIARAQAIYDAWDQQDGMDEELGAGGICDEIAMAISDVLASIPGVELGEYGHDGDDHAAVVASRGPERYLVDIPHSIYESGGGYSWAKIPGVSFSPNDVLVARL